MIDDNLLLLGSHICTLRAEEFFIYLLINLFIYFRFFLSAIWRALIPRTDQGFWKGGAAHARWKCPGSLIFLK